MTKVEHDGSNRQFYNGNGEHPNVTGLMIAPGVTRVGEYAYKDTLITSLGSMEESGITQIAKGAFYGCNLDTLVGLPPSLREIGANAFGGNNSLTNLRGLPFKTTVHINAFNGCGRLRATARSLGFDSIGDWVKNRRLTQHRFAIYSSVRFARWHTAIAPLNTYEQALERAFSGAHTLARPLPTHLRLIAGLTDDLVRVIVEFAYGENEGSTE